MNLISKELIAKVAVDAKLSTSKMEQYVFPSYTNICMGAINVIRGGSETYVHLAENVSKVYYNAWNKDVGKILAKDLRKNNDELYFELTTDTYKVLLRKIREDELAEMTEKGFNHVLIGDFYYVIIKEIPLDGSYRMYTTTSGSELLVDPAASNNTEEDEEEVVEETEEESIESLSLF